MMDLTYAFRNPSRLPLSRLLLALVLIELIKFLLVAELPKQRSAFLSGSLNKSILPFVFITGRGPNTLQEAQVDLIPFHICHREDWYGDIVKKNMICAGFEAGGVDSCQVKWR